MTQEDTMPIKKTWSEIREGAKWRYLEDGGYNNNPIDPEYFSKYYHLKRAIPTECTLCGSMISKGKMFRHVKTRICARKRVERDEASSISE